jgi:hypothetical protein
MEKYWGRCLKGTMSQKMTWVMAMTPPPPTPCTQRPMSMTAKSCATAQNAVPKVKRTMAASGDCCNHGLEDSRDKEISGARPECLSG